MIRPWFRHAAVPWKTTVTQTRASGENRVSTKPGVLQMGRGWRLTSARMTGSSGVMRRRSPRPGVPAGRLAGERRDKPAWRRDMRTSCIEGVAIHGDLGSCVGVREDAGEALTEGDVGWVIEPRNHQSGVPTPSQWPEGNIAGRASASCQRTPRGQRACACVESSGARTGRSRGCPSGCDGRAGRSGNAKAVSPR